MRDYKMKTGTKIKYNNLIGRSIKVLEASKIEKVWQAGIRRDSKNYHMTVMYPPLKAMNKIDEKQIYSDFEKKNKEFTIYVHIPFCSGKCTFCYFYQIEKPSNELIKIYLAAIKKEIKLIANKIKNELHSVKIKSIFFGGGSPTVLTRYQFQDLLNLIKLEFDISSEIETTVEIHPEIIRNNGQALLECYFNNKVNRLNIGVQSFDNNILKITNRRHTAEEVIDIYSLARKIGFKNINIDLLYPLPDLTPGIWEKTLNTAFSLKPESVTTYFTAIRKPSSLYRLLHKAPARFPNEYMNHLLRIMTIEKAREEGYDHRQLIDWFVNPREDFHYEHQKNEVKKTEEMQLLSFGSGVFTYLNYYQYFNYPDIRKYCASLNENKLPIWRGIKLTKEERLARAMVLGIKSGDVNIREIEERFNKKMNEKYDSLLLNLEKLELLEKANENIRLSEKGILFADEIAVQFITPNMQKKLCQKSELAPSEQELVENYNFMYDISRLNILQ
jgi:coproporphyrinogen III oxidase-like Fe-S oxidoreductase